MLHTKSVLREVSCEEQAILDCSGGFKLSASEFVSNPGTKILFFMATSFKLRRRNVSQTSPVVISCDLWILERMSGFIS
jgi:hypothetical protein